MTNAIIGPKGIESPAGEEPARARKGPGPSGSGAGRESEFALALLSAWVGAAPVGPNDFGVVRDATAGEDRRSGSEVRPDQSPSLSRGAETSREYLTPEKSSFARRTEPDFREAAGRTDADQADHSEASRSPRSDPASSAAPSAEAAARAASGSSAASAGAGAAAGSQARATLAETGARALASLAELRAVTGARGPASAAPSPSDPEALADLWLQRLSKMETHSGAAKSNFVIPFDDAAGTGGQVRLAVRGRSLYATIVTTDQKARERLESSLGELRQALIERGFDDARLRVREPRQEDAADYPDHRHNPSPDRQPDGRPPDRQDTRGGSSEIPGSPGDRRRGMTGAKTEEIRA